MVIIMRHHQVETRLNLCNRWRESAIESGDNPVLFFGRLDQLSLQIEAANCALLIEMIESHFLKSLPKEHEAVVQVLRKGKYFHVQIEQAVQEHYACLNVAKQRR